jgi:hypothetical protein
MKTLFRSSLVALLVLGATSSLRADFMDWSYHWSITPGPVLTSGTGSVAMGLAQDGTGASSIPAATVTTTSSATDAAPDRYNVGYNLTLHLTDTPSNSSGALTFHGTIAGTVSADAAHLSNTFSSPTTESVKLGSHLYTVTINPSLMTLAAPGSTTPPQINALVSVTNATGNTPSPPQPPTPQIQTPPPSSGTPGGTVHSSPEPSSLALGMLASGWLGLAALRRRFRAVTLAPNPA